MKKFSHVVLILIQTLVLALTGCGGGNSGGPGGGYTGVAFTMVPVPSQSYEIAQTEVTYELWYAVKTWAVANGYQFTKDGSGNDIAGSEGSMGTRGAAPTANKRHPVTYVNWRDAMVWCNALTEYYNAKSGTSYKCVYYSDSAYTTPIRISSGDFIPDPIPAGSQDAPYVKPDAKGFRLPTSDEWYQAARYIDGTKTYPDNFASGADAQYNVVDKTGIADYDGDEVVRLSSDVAVYEVSSTAEVKSKSPNKLGLYDMSGNVWEWCFDWYPGGEGSWRVEHGGNYGNPANFLQLGYVDNASPDVADHGQGFRPMRNQ